MRKKGISNALTAKYAPKLEFPEGWGVQTKKTKSQKLSETWLSSSVGLY